MADFSEYFDPADDPNQQPGQPPTPPPPPTGGGGVGPVLDHLGGVNWGDPWGSGGNGGGGGGGGFSAGGDFGPQFNFSAFPLFKPKAKFNPLTLEQAQNEPGYKFAEQQGQQGIERSAAARGALRTGGTLKDIGTWIHDFASRGYGDANAREFQRQMAGYQMEKDMYAPLLAEAQAKWQGELQRALAQYGRYTVWNAPRGGGGGGGGGPLSYEEWKAQNGY